VNTLGFFWILKFSAMAESEDSARSGFPTEANIPIIISGFWGPLRVEKK
jgi:hypothetical protein